MAERLYPPILNYSLPAFAIQSGTTRVRIYFALSDYSSNTNASVQMTVRYQDNNENALKTSTYKGRVKAFKTYSTDNEKITQKDRYYVELLSTDLQNGFTIDRIYKIQLRFSSIYTSASPDTNWLNSHLSNFSEWSTVCLIKPISKPTYSVMGLDTGEGSSILSIYTTVDSIFNITYNQGTSNELLKSWRTILYNSDKTTIFADSGWKTYTNYDYLPVDNSNTVTFDSILPYIMEDGNNYILQLSIETRNGYTATTDYAFVCSPILSNDFVGNITLQMNEEEGYATLHVTSETPYSTNLVLRRSSSESNFTIWEDVALKVLTNEAVNWIYKDFTIESGIWYRYGVQIRDVAGRRGSLTVLSSVEMAEFEHAFLLGENNQQLKLKYDFNISSANITVSESKTDTIGSKFPFIRRNGHMYYRTFQCTGLITGYMDIDEHLFTTDAELYNNNQNRYKTVRTAVDAISTSYDYTYEREFREKVQEFLYDNKVKLYKSLQEGNMLVKIMNVSLSPKNELGRLLYNFSALVVEIDEPTLTNLQTYNLQSIAPYASSIEFSESILGQLTNYNGYDKGYTANSGIEISIPRYTAYPADKNLMQIIGEKYGWQYGSNNIIKNPINNILVNDFQLTYLRVELESDPYLIYKDGDNLIPFNESNYAGTTAGTTAVADNLILGWLINFSESDAPILIQPPNNIYELNVENFILSSNTNISFPVDTAATIYYTIQLNEEFDSASTTPLELSYNTIIGQLNRIFEPTLLSEDIIQLLATKYQFVDYANNIKYELNTVSRIDIEAEPGTVIYARSSAMPNTNSTKFVLNETGRLLLEPNIGGANITTARFNGKQIDLRYLYPLYSWDSIDDHTLKAIQAFNRNHNKGTIKPITPKTYDFYIENNLYYMYYNREWNLAESISKVDTNDILTTYVWEITCPVRALVNYELQQQRGKYEQVLNG